MFGAILPIVSEWTRSAYWNEAIPEGVAPLLLFSGIFLKSQLDCQAAG
jgi:hypothetical protein